MSEKVAVGDPTTRGTATMWLPTPPTRIGPVSTNVLAASAEEHRVCGGEGRWSNADVYVSLPADWLVEDPEVRLYAVTNGSESLVAFTNVAAAGLQIMGDGGLQGLILNGRGHPASAWSVRVVNAAGNPLGSASFVLECWGQESTPEGIGPTPANPGAVFGPPDGVEDQRVPYRAVWIMGWPWGEAPNGGPGETGGPWLPLNMNRSTGALLVEGAGGGGAFVVSGDVTPSDAFANPTDAIPAFSFLGGWNGATWDRVRTGSNNPAAKATTTLGVVEVNATLWASERSGAGGLLQRLEAQTTNQMASGLALGGDQQLMVAAMATGVDMAGANQLVHRVNLPGLRAGSQSLGTQPVQIVGALTQLEDPASAGAFRSAQSAFTSPTSTLTSVQAVQPVGQFNTAPPAPTNGQIVPLQADGAGNALVTGGLPPLDSAKAMTFASLAGVGVSSFVMVAVPCQLLSLMIGGNLAGFLQLHNLAAAPGAGAVPVMSWLNYGTGNFIFERSFWGDHGRFFSIGLTAAFSSTANTFTAAAPGASGYIVGYRT